MSLPAPKTAARYLMAISMMAVGVLHFLQPQGFVLIVPKALPFPLALVYVSGFFEVVGGAGLLVPAYRKAAAWGLIVLFLAVFPANINMAVNKIALDTTTLPDWALWGRLPLQFVLIAWAWWVAQDETPSSSDRSNGG